MIERTFVKQAYKKLELENYLKKELKKAGFTKAEVNKTPLVTRIIIHATHPGLAIGKSGQNIRRLTEEIEKKFEIDNPQIEIKEIIVPELDAQAMADRISSLIERGYSWRSVVYKAAKDIQAAGAQGVEILLGGALGGKGGRKRRQRIAAGYMKKVGEQARLVDSAKTPAYAKFGAIGIKVKIVRPDTVFPDKIVGEKMLENWNKGKEKTGKAEEKPAEAAEEKGGERAEEKPEKTEEKEKKPEEKKKEGAKKGKEKKAEEKPAKKEEGKKGEKSGPEEKKKEEAKKAVKPKKKPAEREEKKEAKGEEKGKGK